MQSSTAVRCSLLTILLSPLWLVGCAGGPDTTRAPAVQSERIIPLGLALEDPEVRLAQYGGTMKKSPPPEVIVNITSDSEHAKGRIFANGQEHSLAELRNWLYPVARSTFDPKTKLSNVTVLIRCDRDAPFQTVQHVMQVCADRDLKVDKIALAVESRLATPLPTGLAARDVGEARIRVKLSNQGERCICYVNGKSVGPMPDARAPASKRIKTLRKNDQTWVDIDPDPKVPHRHVIEIIEACRRAKVKNVSFTGALPDLPKPKR